MKDPKPRRLDFYAFLDYFFWSIYILCVLIVLGSAAAFLMGWV